MEDRDFFDLLYQQWSMTTNAKDDFWMSELVHRYTTEPHEEIWGVYSVHVSEDGEQARKPIATDFHSEADADFVTAVHGCLPDLIRRLHQALDEADRLDRERDERENRIFNLELQVDDLKGKLEGK